MCIEIRWANNLYNIFYVQRPVIRTSCQHIRLRAKLSALGPLWINLRSERFVPLQPITIQCHGGNQKENPHHWKNRSTFPVPVGHHGPERCQIQPNHQQTCQPQRRFGQHFLRDWRAVRISWTWKLRPQKTTQNRRQRPSCWNLRW